MFEVITQSQPHDWSSLEILKEAYAKLGREKDAISTSKRIAQAYVQMGQLSSAILEYETILQRYPDDPDVQAALKEIESKANNFPTEPPAGEGGMPNRGPVATANRAARPSDRAPALEIEDGRRAMHKVFVESRLIAQGDFDLCWPTPDLSAPPRAVVEPFIQILANKGVIPVERSLKVLSDRSRLGYLPLQVYDIDLELARKFPADTCRRWCVLPFDRMSKSILVATVNPFNQQAAKELSLATQNRILWYLAPPGELVKCIRKAFR
jgi:tetratricopeptide (TPR) repeat protein